MKFEKFGKFLAIATLLTTTGAATIVTAQAAENDEPKTYESNGVVKFVPNTDPTEPTDPTDPGESIKPVDPTNPNGPNPGTTGPLSIDYASSLDFGVNKISSKDETYYANAQTYSDKDKATANYIQISDHRGSSAGWSLTVKQEQQFENAEAKYSELKGAAITINDSVAVSNSEGVEAPTTQANIVLEPGTAVAVMDATEGAGDGTWINRFGKVEKVAVEQEDGSVKDMDKNTSVQLDVPGSTPKSAVEYRASLTWILAEVAGNNN